MEKAKEYLHETSRPVGRRSSVRYGNCTRFIKAEEQAKLEPIDVSVIIKHTVEFLGLLNMNLDERFNPKQDEDIDSISSIKSLYEKIKQENSLADKRDIVWMKFTRDGFLGVVATSNDINFDMPPSKDEYNNKHSTSGIIIHNLGKTWDEDFVLIFPLRKIPADLKRGDVERGIGNYLIKKGVPILDFFSHRY
ncbi:MAG: hypothetical protein ACOX8S_02320 [Christensenellales bacterium]